MTELSRAAKRRLRKTKHDATFSSSFSSSSTSSSSSSSSSSSTTTTSSFKSESESGGLSTLMYFGSMHKEALTKHQQPDKCIDIAKRQMLSLYMGSNASPSTVDIAWNSKFMAPYRTMTTAKRSAAIMSKFPKIEEKDGEWVNSKELITFIRDFNEEFDEVQDSWCLDEEEFDGIGRFCAGGGFALGRKAGPSMSEVEDNIAKKKTWLTQRVRYDDCLVKVPFIRATYAIWAPIFRKYYSLYCETSLAKWKKLALALQAKEKKEGKDIDMSATAVHDDTGTSFSYELNDTKSKIKYYEEHVKKWKVSTKSSSSSSSSVVEEKTSAACEVMWKSMLREVDFFIYNERETQVEYECYPTSFVVLLPGSNNAAVLIKKIYPESKGEKIHTVVSIRNTASDEFKEIVMDNGGGNEVVSSSIMTIIQQIANIPPNKSEFMNLVTKLLRVDCCISHACQFLSSHEL